MSISTCSERKNTSTDSRRSSTSVVGYTKLRPSANVDRQHLEVTLLALLFMRGLNFAEDFYMASNMEAAGCFDVACRYQLSGYDAWRTAFIQTTDEDTRHTPTQSAKADLGFLTRQCQAYANIKSKHAESSELRFCGQFNTFHFIIFTSALFDSELMKREKNSSDVVRFFSTVEIAFSFDQKTDCNVYKGVSKFGELNAMSDELKDETSEEIKRERFERKATANSLQCKQLVETPTSGVEVRTDCPLYDEFLGKLQIYSSQSNQTELERLVMVEVQAYLGLCDVQACLRFCDWKSCAQVSKDVQAGIKLWWETENYFLSNRAEFWLKIIAAKVREYSKSVLRSINHLEANFIQQSLNKLHENLPSAGFINILVVKNGSMMLTTLQVYQALTTLDDRYHIFCYAGDFLHRRDEIAKLWQNSYCGSLVIVSEPDTTQDDVVTTSCLLDGIRRTSKVALRVIFISKTNLTLAAVSKLYSIEFDEYQVEISWNNLSVDTQERLLSSSVVFQGQKLRLRKLINREMEEGLMDGLSGKTLEKLLRGEKVSIGRVVEKQIEYYVPRKLTRGEEVIDITCLSDIGERIVLLAAEPGMGKSTLMTQLAIAAKEVMKSKWVACVNLNDCTSYLKDLKVGHINKKNAIEFMKIFSTATESEFERKILNNRLLYSGNMCVFIDGVDEVLPQYEDKVCTLLQSLLETKIENVWVSTRLVAKYKLEKILKTSAFLLEPFSKNDQTQFLALYWKKKMDLFDEAYLDTFINNILKLAHQTFKGEPLIISIPQKTLLYAEYFEKYLGNCKNAGTVTLPTRINLLLLCNRFIGHKCKLQQEGKGKIDQKELENVTHIEKSKNLFLKRHKYAALLQLFTSQDLMTINVNTDDVKDFVEMVGEGSENTSLVGEIINGKPRFLHEIFAEYFAAIWFAENYPSCRQFLKSKLLEPGFQVFMDLFDRYLTKDFELHSAVLSGDTSLVAQILSQTDFHVNKTDSGGRSALHLAVIYSGMDGHVNFLQIVKMLLKKGAEIDLKDEVFQWFPVEFADKTNAWQAAAAIMQTSGRRMEMKRAEEQMVPIVYNEFITYLCHSDCTHFGLLFAASQHGDMKVIHFLETIGVNVHARDQAGNSALMVASRFGTLQVVQHLVKFGTDVNRVNVSGWSALLIALDFGQDEVFHYLIQSGAKLERSTSRHETAQKNAVLLCAARLGDMSLVQHQLEKGADVNGQTADGWSALFLASAQGHISVMEHLILKGAMIVFNWNDTHLLTQKNMALLCAAFVGDNDVIVKLMKMGADVSFHNFNGWNSLMLGMIRNKHDTVDFLLSNHVFINVNNAVKGTQIQKDISLQCLAVQGNFQGVKDLVSNQANVFYVNKGGWNVVMLATLYGHIEIMSYFYKMYPKEDAVQRSNRSLLLTNMRLLWYSFTGSPVHIKRMLDLGGGVNAENKAGWNATLLAGFQGHLNCMEYLYSQGGIVNTSNIKNISLEQSNAALCCAAFEGSVEKVSKLLARGAHKNVRKESGWNPLTISTHQGNRDVMDYLSARGSYIELGTNGNKLDNLTNVLLICASYQGDLIKVKEMINQGADVNAENKEMWNSLMYATDKGNEDCMRYLLDHKAVVKITHIENLTAHQRDVNLLSATFEGNLNTVKMYVSNLASVNCINEQGTSPLHWAVLRTNYQLVEYLVDNGASVNASDNHGVRPLHQLCMASHSLVKLQSIIDRDTKVKIARLLLSKGAETNVQNSDSKTPADLARNTRQFDLLRIFYSEVHLNSSPNNK